MKPYIWYSKKSKVTGRVLRENLNINGGMSPPPSDTDFLVCWGMSNGNISHLNLGENNVCILNHPDGSKNAVDKLKTLQLLSENNVSVPNFQTVEDINENGLNLNYPLLGRKRFHQGGSFIYICKRFINGAMRKGVDYFMEFVNSSTEYRVHIFNNKIVKIAEKVPSEDGVTKTDIRNHRYGWRFAWRPFKDKNYPRGILNESLKAMNVLGLFFGAVDVLWGTDNKPYILEINTAPTLDNSSMEQYINRIHQKMEEASEKIKRPV